ncbi:MAG: LicD family protein [Paramuribaculum sp.]|nr:LicD family protein [Paramuribaculum sp.]
MENKKELTIKEKQGIILEIMKDIDGFCRKNGIPYSLSSGTLLGAVRHGGFIPWDDDADMFMLREDFDRFVATYQSDRFGLLFNTRSDRAFFASGYAKVNDPTTHIVETLTMANHGVFVDIFPLDRVPSDEKERKRHMHKVMSLHNRIYHRQRKDLISIIKSHRHSLDWWMNKMDETVRDPRYADSNLVAHIVGSDNYRTVLERDCFKRLGDITFEGYPFLALTDIDMYLTMVYGTDYMTPKKWSHNLKVYRR